MFDLSEELSLDLNKKKTTSNKAVTSLQRAGVTVFYSTIECKEKILEAYRFEGLDLPTCYKGSPVQGKDQELGEVIIVELLESTDLINDAEQLNALLPNDKAVVIIGQTDSIQTLRHLEKRGFYYSPWPADKLDLISCFKRAEESRNQLEAQSVRKAKRVAVLGSKGGVGASVLSTELSALLAKNGSQTVLVDHQYAHSNIDIILSQKDLEQVDINTITVERSKIDEESASNYITEVERNFNYLGLIGDVKQEELEKFTNTISAKLSRRANFIVNDFSASVDFRLDIEEIVDDHDVIVLLCEPSVSSVRATQRLLETIKDTSIPKMVRPRVLTVLNQHRPESCFNLNKEEVERFIKRDLDIVIPFYKTAAKQLIEGKKLRELEKSNAAPFTQLAMLINGQKVTKRKGLFDLFKRKK